MAEARWMIYGATGFTGRLMVAEAVRRGLRPLLAGRDERALKQVAEPYHLDTITARLDDPARLRQALEGCRLVLHAAGPFIHTSRPMVDACLETRAHYLDITGEVPVFEQIFARDADAFARGVALIPGVGFDVVPSDCLAGHVARQVPGATWLEIGVASTGVTSAGTAQTSLEHLRSGFMVRRNGALTAAPQATHKRSIRFLDRERPVLPISWGDLSTAYRSTGILNITTYMAFPEQAVEWLPRAGGLLGRLMSLRPVRALANAWVRRNIKGPDEAMRQAARGYVWARAAGTHGDVAEAWLETAEVYAFTAAAGLRVVEGVLSGGLPQPGGALTPAQAFGPDFVLEIPGTRRFDRLPQLQAAQPG